MESKKYYIVPKEFSYNMAAICKAIRRYAPNGRWNSGDELEHFPQYFQPAKDWDCIMLLVSQDYNYVWLASSGESRKDHPIKITNVSEKLDII